VAPLKAYARFGRVCGVYGNIFAYAPVNEYGQIIYTAKAKLFCEIVAVLPAEHNESRALHPVFVESARNIHTFAADMSAVASHIVFALRQKLFHTAVDIEGGIKRKRQNFHCLFPFAIIIL
jgi:hypothetical protein